MGSRIYRRISALAVSLSTLTAAILVAALGLAAAPASAAASTCQPASTIKNRLTASNVGVSVATSGKTITYTLDSFMNESPVGGIPGLIDLCVYPSTQPGLLQPLAHGADGSAWATAMGTDNFQFIRTDGDKSNVPLDGTSQNIGSATWTTKPLPTTQTIILHINDPAECARLYGAGTLTCYVKPGTRPLAKPLTISKDAAGHYTDTYPWSLLKRVCLTGVQPCTQSYKTFGDGTATFDYLVRVGHGDSQIGDVTVTGTVTVTNPNSGAVHITGVTDALSTGTTCTVTNGGAQVLQPGDTTFSYKCAINGALLPRGVHLPAALTNKATVSWDTQVVPGDGSLAAGSANTADIPVNFTGTEKDTCVNVTDTFDGASTSLGTVCTSDPNPTDINYSHTVNVPVANCTEYKNTAGFTTNDTGNTGSASQTVKVCGPALLGARTIGFWQNKNNGQDIIKKSAATNGVCNVGTWLRQFPPFQDLSATASCDDVASYYLDVFANGEQVKVQMLATALDVYFSDPALGGNQISAPSPIGSQTIDLTQVCTAPHESTNPATLPATCGPPPTYEDTSSAFDTLTCPSTTVMALLTYAGSQSNVGGTIWYGSAPGPGNTLAGLAKDTFDAINNSAVFNC